MKTRAAFLITGHFLALLLGAAIAHAWKREFIANKTGNISTVSITSPGTSNPSRTNRSARNTKKEQPLPDSATLKGAWELMQQQTAVDRARLRPLLLAKWAQVNLQAALEAALMETDSADLLSAFGATFDKDPNAFKPLLSGEPFGLKSADLRNWWIEKMGVSHPDELLALIGEFSSFDQDKIIRKCADGMTSDPEKLWGMINGFAKLPDTPANRKLWAQAANAVAARQNANTVVEKLSAIKGAAGDAMISEAMSVLLNRTDYAGARATYASLPADLKPQIVQAALKKPGSNVSAYLAALDEVINTPDWTTLQKPLAVKLHDMNANPQQYPAMLDWAAKLPERDDTMDIYRVAVRKFVTNQPDQAREWIAGMPKGWKQQNSLTAYVQSALFARGDVEGAKWAIPQISDPRFRVEADGFLKTYEEKNKGK